MQNFLLRDLLNCAQEYYNGMCKEGLICLQTKLSVYFKVKFCPSNSCCLSCEATEIATAGDRISDKKSLTQKTAKCTLKETGHFKSIFLKYLYPHYTEDSQHTTVILLHTSTLYLCNPQGISWLPHLLSSLCCLLICPDQFSCCLDSVAISVVYLNTQ